MTKRLASVWLALLLALAACGAAAPGTPADPAAEGQRLFALWCSGCHGVEPGVPDTLGPNLAGVATRAAANPDGLSAADWLYRETATPNATIAPGYSPGLMPAYEQSLRPDQLDALVAYMLTLE
ncbi:MAG TPA: cytochrome c [Chloroflexaceae bacterium]|nr:cytochrome c [Chloroflexaceae bacterium]